MRELLIWVSSLVAVVVIVIVLIEKNKLPEDVVLDDMFVSKPRNLTIKGNVCIKDSSLSVVCKAKHDTTTDLLTSPKDDLVMLIYPDSAGDSINVEFVFDDTTKSFAVASPQQILHVSTYNIAEGDTWPGAHMDEQGTIDMSKWEEYLYPNFDTLTTKWAPSQQILQWKDIITDYEIGLRSDGVVVWRKR